VQVLFSVEDVALKEFLEFFGVDEGGQFCAGAALCVDDGEDSAVGRAAGGHPHLLPFLEGQPLPIYLVLVVDRAPDHLVQVERKHPPVQLAVAEVPQDAAPEGSKGHSSAVQQPLSPLAHHHCAVFGNHHAFPHFLMPLHETLEEVVFSFDAFESGGGVGVWVGGGLVVALVVVVLFVELIPLDLGVGVGMLAGLGVPVVEALEHELSL